MARQFAVGSRKTLFLVHPTSAIAGAVRQGSGERLRYRNPVDAPARESGRAVFERLENERIGDYVERSLSAYSWFSRLGKR